jgi:hypothetical protein
MLLILQKLESARDLDITMYLGFIFLDRWHLFLVKISLHVQALDTIKKSSSSMPKDDIKRLEKEVSN